MQNNDNRTPPGLQDAPTMQGNGAEMLRLACCFMTERGMAVCAPLHDAVLIEAPLDVLESAVEKTQRAMAEEGDSLRWIALL